MADDSCSPESIHAMAAAAKELVASATQWMIDLQSLPVEDAEAEYLQSKSDADDMVETMRAMQEEYYQSTASGDWVESFLTEICDPFGVEATTSLLRQALTAPRWILSSTESSFGDSDSGSVLQHSAHCPGFCLKSECLIGMSDWQHEMTFRTAFEAAPFFSDQVYHYLDRISGLSRLEELREITTFQDVLTICRTERKDALGTLRPCVCVEQLQDIIDYEAAWLLHSSCGKPAPRQRDFPTPFWLTSRTEKRSPKVVSPLGGSEVGPFKPPWLRQIFSVDDNRTLKPRLGKHLRIESQRKWYVPADCLNAVGDWKQILRDASKRMPETERKEVEAFLSLQ